MTDRVYTPANNLKDWLKDFADKELKRGNMFDDIKDAFNKKNNDVESKVNDLRSRVGLDKLAEKDKIRGGMADNQPDEKFDKEQLEKGIRIELEHTDDKNIAKEITKDHLTESKDFKNQEGAKYYDKLENLEDSIKDELTKTELQVMLNLVTVANELRSTGKLKVANLIKNKIEKISEKSKVFKKNENVKQHIDNVCESRKGHIDAPALLDIIKSRKEKFTDKELDEIKDYINLKLKKEKEDLKMDDSNIGKLEVHLFTVNDEDNKDIFNQTPKE